MLLAMSKRLKDKEMIAAGMAVKGQEISERRQVGDAIGMLGSGGEEGDGERRSVGMGI